MHSLQYLAKHVVMKSVDYSFLGEDVSKKLGLVPRYQIEKIRKFRGSNIDSYRGSYCSSFFAAARLGFKEAFQYFFELLESKREEDFKIDAAKHGYKEALKHYKESDEYVYNKALVCATEGGNIEIMKLLKATDFNKPMKIAANLGRIDMVKLCMERGATNVNAAMCKAALGGHIEIVKLLIDWGADAFQDAMENAAEKGHIEIVKFFKERDDDELLYYSTALRYAAQRGFIDIVNCLKDEERDWGFIIEHAAENGHIDIVKLCFEKDVKYQWCSWDHVIHYAIIEGFVEIVRFFLEHKDSFRQEHLYSIDLMIINAAFRGHIDIVKLCKDYSVNNEIINGAMCCAAEGKTRFTKGKHHDEIIKQCIEWGADVNILKNSPKIFFDTSSKVHNFSYSSNGSCLL